MRPGRSCARRRGSGAVLIAFCLAAVTTAACSPVTRVGATSPAPSLSRESPSPGAWPPEAELDVRISASPSPAVIWPRGSRGDLVEQALLQRFRNARTLDRKPPEAAPFTSGRITVMGETQIGAAAVGHPECRRWSQGVWSVAGSLRDEPGGVLGAVFLIDTTKGPFAGPTLSESITYASDAALRRLSAADPPAECRTIRMSDGRTSWTKRYHRVAPPDLPGGQAQAYLLRDESGTVPPTWVALTRYGDYLIEVRLVVRPVTDDVASQRAMLAELLRQAHARAASTLR